MSAPPRLITGVTRFRFAIYGFVMAVAAVTVWLAPALWLRLGAAALLVVFFATAGLDFYRTVPRGLGQLLRGQRDLSVEMQGLAHRQERLANRLDSTISSLRGLVQIAEQTRAAAESDEHGEAVRQPAGDLPHVLFVTSNGSGLGHLTRLSAIADAGFDYFTSSFVSLSTAAELVTRRGYDVTKIESQSTSGLTWPEWNRRFSREFHHQLSLHNPQAVVFDGVQMFRGVHERSAARDIPVIWVCRGLWKTESSRSHLRQWRDVASELIIPSEGVIVPPADSHPDPSVGGKVTPPIFIDEAVKPLSREDALRSLQLPTDAEYVLIQLGSGAQGGREEFVQQAIDSINELDPQLVPVLLRSPLAKDKSFENLDGQFEVRSQYPVAAHLQAFAFSVGAAGYNSVHENIAALHPAIYVPEARMITDDQVRRAEAMAEMKAGLIVRAVEELPAAIGQMADPQFRAELEQGIGQIGVGSGAAVAADAIVATIAEARPGLAVGSYHASRGETS